MIVRSGCRHAQDAAAQRYGLALDEDDFRAMVAAIVLAAAGDARNALLLYTQRSGREVWLVRVPSGPAVRVVYSPRRAQIVTILPAGYRMPRGDALLPGWAIP